MGFFTKIDYTRQLRQHSGTSVTFSGSSEFEQFLIVGSGITIGNHGCYGQQNSVYTEDYSGETGQPYASGNLDIGWLHLLRWSVYII